MSLESSRPGAHDEQILEKSHNFTQFSTVFSVFLAENLEILEALDDG